MSSIDLRISFSIEYYLALPECKKFWVSEINKKIICSKMNVDFADKIPDTNDESSSSSSRHQW